MKLKPDSDMDLMARGPSFERASWLATMLRIANAKAMADPADDDTQEMRAAIGDNQTFARLLDADKDHLFSAMLTIRHRLQIYDELVKFEEEDPSPLLSALTTIVAAIQNYHGLLSVVADEMRECGETPVRSSPIAARTAGQASSCSWVCSPARRSRAKIARVRCAAGAIGSGSAFLPSARRPRQCPEISISSKPCVMPGSSDRRRQVVMGAGLKKLLKFKTWLTVPDAARHLSILFGEDVTEADVLRFALDGHLTLSVDFVNQATARCGKIIPLADAEIKEVKSLNGDGVVRLLKGGIQLDEERVFSYSRDVTYIEGIWDLTMLGAERLDVEHKYQFLTDGPAVESTMLDGPLVSHPEGTWCQLLQRFSEKNLNSPRNHPDNYYPAGALPEDAVLVVRTSALQDLEALISEPEAAMERPVGQRERTTLLVIIAALAELARIDVKKPSKAALTIETQTALLGARVAARTIENKLKLIPEAIESKAED